MFSVIMKINILMLLSFLMNINILVLTKVQYNPNTMLSQTFAQIRNLSNQLPDPIRADRAMHQLLCTNVKLTRKVLTKNLLKTVMKKNIATNDVMKYAKGVCKQNVKNTNLKAMIHYAMKMKVKDAEYDESITRKIFNQKMSEYKSATVVGSLADVEFRNIMKYEVESVWSRGKLKNKEKVFRIMMKYAPMDENGNVRDVIVTDEMLTRMGEHSEKNAKVFGGVQINENETKAIKMDPEFRIYKRIDAVDLEVEIEKGCTKARYHFMSEKEGGNIRNIQVPGDDDNIDSNNNDRDTFKEFDAENKIANYANIRATDLPTVQRLFPPQPSTIRREVIMQSIKDKMLNKVHEYKEKHCNDKGFIKNSNVTRAVSDGIKSIKERIRDKEVVVFATDKTGELSIDSTSNYLDALKKHTVNDRKIDKKTVKTLENRCNDHLKQFNKMFSVGATFGHEQRVANASTATNVPAPPLYGLRKTHKPVPDPPVRPVCGASNAPNSRLGHFLSRIVNHFTDCTENSTECRSSEDMRAAFSTFNKLSKSTKLKCQILSMDVKALYPSMSWEEIIKSVKWIIMRSDMKIENVDWFEAGKYLAVMMTKEEIVEEGLQHVVPKREGGQRNISINYLRHKKNENKWLPARRPGVRQQKKMLALAVSYGVYTVMSCHT